MAYSEKVIDHFDNPRNVGSLDKKDRSVGTGVVGAPECGDVMKTGDSKLSCLLKSYILLNSNIKNHNRKCIMAH